MCIEAEATLPARLACSHCRQLQAPLRKARKGFLNYYFYLASSPQGQMGELKTVSIARAWVLGYFCNFIKSGNFPVSNLSSLRLIEHERSYYNYFLWGKGGMQVKIRWFCCRLQVQLW